MTERQFRLTDGVDVVAVEVLAIKETIVDVHMTDLSALCLDIYSKSTSALEAHTNLVIRHKGIAELKYFVKRSEVEVHLDWIRAQVGNTYIERASTLAKAATEGTFIDLKFKVTHRQVNIQIFGRALSKWEVGQHEER